MGSDLRVVVSEEGYENQDQAIGMKRHLRGYLAASYRHNSYRGASDLLVHLRLFFQESAPALICGQHV